MSLAGSVDYWDYARKNSGGTEVWLVKVFFDNEDAADYIGLATRDITVSSKFYYGVILDPGSITDTIDLKQSKATLSNIDIKCINRYGNTTLGAKLWPNTTTRFINRKVEIYSRFGDTTDLADTRLIYSGRLFNISQEGEKLITLHIEERTPADYIKIPNQKTTDGKLYFPIIYGDYDASGNSVATPTHVTNKNVHPLQVHSLANNYLYLLSPAAQTENVHIYQPNVDLFYELEDGLAYISHQGGYATKQPAACEHGFLFRPTGIGDNDDFTNSENAYDGNTATDATVSFNQSVASLTTYTFNVDYELPKFEGDFSYFRARTYHSLDIIAGDGNALFDCQYYLNTFAGGTYGGDLFAKIGTDADITDTWSAFENLLTEYGTENDIADNLTYHYTIENDDLAAQTITVNLTIGEVELSAVAFYDRAGNKRSSYDRAVNAIEKLYSSNDGNTNSFTTSIRSGSVSVYPYEILRDMLYRYASYDASDANMVGYSALNTARANDSWECKIWLFEPVELRNILQTLQFEGGFIFRFTNTGGKFIFVKNTYSSADVAHTITKDDYEGEIGTNLTEFSDLITKTIWDYDLHPATDEPQEQVTYTNTAARSAYWNGIGANENVATIRLEYLKGNPYDSGADTNPNDCVALYYNNIWGKPRIKNSVTLINPKMFDLETGDIVLYDEDHANLGYSTTVYHLVTSITRGIGRITINTEEVYNA